jgi:hypothetical protein
MIKTVAHISLLFNQVAGELSSDKRKKSPKALKTPWSAS